MADEGASGDQGAAPDAAAVAAAAAQAEGVADTGKKEGTGTALDLDTGGKDDKVITAPADFPEDWRAKMAGEDKDTLKKLERYKSPADVAKALRAAETRISKGLTSDPMPDPEKDPDGAKAWRKDRGIPDDAAGYELPKPVLEKLTDADKPVLASFTEFAHKKGARPDVVQIASEWYVDMQDQAFAQRQATDKKQSEETQDTLRSELGKEFRPALTVAKRFAEESGVNDLLEARLPDGRKVGNVVELVRSLIDVGMQKYGDVSFAGGEASAKTESRKAEIERIRDTDWHKYSDDQAMQKEYQGILEAEQKRKGK